MTINPIEALANSSSLVGFGLTMEGQEGNEIVYDLLLDQAWSGSPLDTVTYFHNWVTRRYAGTGTIPAELYIGWEILRYTVYSNTNITFTTAVTRSIVELSPNITGLTNRIVHHGSTAINYNPQTLIEVWNTMFNASTSNPSLWDNPAYQYDMTDITRQVMANSFIDIYNSLIDAYTYPTRSNATLASASKKLTTLLTTLDTVLSTNPSFSLSTWLDAARAQVTNTSSPEADFFEYEARNQITLWGPDGEIPDYASKSWGGLVKGYYLPRWEIFVEYLGNTSVEAYNVTELNRRLRTFENAWQKETVKEMGVLGDVLSLQDVLGGLRETSIMIPLLNV